jgi:hypothetical protein
LKIFENMVLRGIFGPKREGVTRGWRRLHNKELVGAYYNACQSARITAAPKPIGSDTASDSE